MSTSSTAANRFAPAPLRPANGDRAWKQPECVPPAPPLVPVALAVFLGIALDRLALSMRAGSAALASLALAAAGLVLLLLLQGRRWLSQAALLLGLVMLGAVHHHERWNGLKADDLARADGVSAHPAWIRGVVVTVPEYRPGFRPEDDGSTRFLLDVLARSDGRSWQRATGCVLVLARGNRTDLRMGHPLQAAGTLEPIPGPRNPGESDTQSRWRAEGVRLRMNVDIPDALLPDRQGPVWHGHALLGRIRSESYERLIAGLRPDVAALAAALLLGRYDSVDSETLADFSRTGTTHLLAISGLHMQALALVLNGLLVVLGVGRKRAALLVIAATLAYTILVGARPSVVRSAAMTITLATAVLVEQPVQSANMLALAALVTIGINPSFLFDTGCQLSFLAVGALFWVFPPVARWLGIPPLHESGPDPTTAREWLDRLEKRLWPWPRRILDRIARGIILAVITSIVVWLVTLPLILYAFHLLPLVGCLLNVPLVAISTPTLASVIFLVPAGSLGGPVKRLARWLCEALLSPQRRAISWAAGLPAGFFYSAGPPTGWLVAFYLCLGLCTSAFCPPRRAWARWSTCLALLASTIAIVHSVAVPRVPGTLEVEVLAVDHGLAVLVQSPSGQTLLYDCGRLRDPHVGARIIAPALWHRGVRSIDTLVLSHADADHYGGLPELIDRISIAEVCVPPGFDRAANPGAAELIGLCRERSIAVRELVVGSAIDLGPQVAARVLNPEPGDPGDRPDNESSVVLHLSSLGRSILLTGDLEGKALQRLLAEPPVKSDVLLSPHHGARAANPAELFRWADPGLLVISQREPAFEPSELLGQLGLAGRRVMTTWQNGAIRLRWAEKGILASGFLNPSH